MDNHILALKLILEHLGIEPSIETVDQRKAVQKAIYLAQRAGLDMGYRFSWYLMGPYCSSLAKDYYSLADAKDSDPMYHNQDATLIDSAKQVLNQIKPVLQKPAEFTLSDSDWLELVASWNYLIHVSGKSEQEALETIKFEKPRLAEFVELAKQKLRANRTPAISA